MDVLAHALYGATACSRTGLAGGLKGTGRRPWLSDWTVWCSAAFGVLPDAVSLGPPIVAFLLGGGTGNFFATVGGDSIVRYRWMHSLIVALAASGILRLAWKPLFVPSLAWALHVLADALTHASGKFQTTFFYPLSSWHFDGIRWWLHPGLMIAYWMLLPIIWFALSAWRRRRRRETAGHR